MPFIVNATRVTQGAGAGTFPARTSKDALEKASDLRKQGLTVVITDEDGQPVNEEDLEDDALEAPKAINVTRRKLDKR